MEQPPSAEPPAADVPPPLALLAPLAARRLDHSTIAADDARDPRSDEYVVPVAAVERVAAAVRACVGAWGETAERREAAVDGLRAAVEGLWTAWGDGGGAETHEATVALADAVAEWEKEATTGEEAEPASSSTLLEDLVHCALSLLGHARPDVPSDLALSADDECQLALANGALGLRLAAALCVSPLLAQPFLHAGGGYALQAVLSNPLAPTGPWTVPCLRALWHAIQDPTTLADFVEEGRVPDVQPYLAGGAPNGGGAASGGPSFAQAVLLLLARCVMARSMRARGAGDPPHHFESTNGRILMNNVTDCRRHLSAEATALARRIVVRCALREALERAARLAGTCGLRVCLSCFCRVHHTTEAQLIPSSTCWKHKNYAQVWRPSGASTTSAAGSWGCRRPRSARRRRQPPRPSPSSRVRPRARTGARKDLPHRPLRCRSGWPWRWATCGGGWRRTGARPGTGTAESRTPSHA